ncbi:MAG: DsbA family protein [Anaerolineales bacterium]|nr:DsbA family protein [Anaerolineales bacterium]
MHPNLSFLRRLDMPLMLVIGLALGFFLWGADETQTAFANLPQPNAARFANLDVSGFPAYGPEDAPVTIVEFADYECPYCQQWQAEVWPLIHQQYGDQIRRVFVDFPLSSIHAEAFRAAEATHCAGAQGQYWPYHTALFARTDELSQAFYPLLAQDLGLDVPKFSACLETGIYAEQVRQGILLAYDLGLSATPAFVINGQPVAGAQSFEVFQAIIEQELGQ